MSRFTADEDFVALRKDNPDVKRESDLARDKLIEAMKNGLQVADVPARNESPLSKHLPCQHLPSHALPHPIPLMASVPTCAEARMSCSGVFVVAGQVGGSEAGGR